MLKIMTFMGFMFAIGTALSAAFGGNVGFVSTALAADIDSDDTSMPVSSVSGFLPNADVVVVDGEVIKYTSLGTTSGACTPLAAPCFLGLTRGHENSKASAHLISAQVYNDGLGAFNTMLGFDIAESTVSVKGVQTPLPNVKLWASGFARMLTADYAFLEGGIGQMVAIFGIYILFIGIVGFVFILFISVVRGLLLP